MACSPPAQHPAPPQPAAADGTEPISGPVRAVPSLRTRVAGLPACGASPTRAESGRALHCAGPAAWPPAAAGAGGPAVPAGPLARSWRPQLSRRAAGTARPGQSGQPGARAPAAPALAAAQVSARLTFLPLYPCPVAPGSPGPLASTGHSRTTPGEAQAQGCPRLLNCTPGCHLSSSAVTCLLPPQISTAFASWPRRCSLVSE